MKALLFDGKHIVSEEEVLENVLYFYNRAGQAMGYWSKGEKKIALDLARSLRNKLRDEYKNNDLVRIQRIYGDDKNFINYRAAVHEAYASIVGQLTLRNAYSFLYDVQSYMSYYFPKVRNT